MTLSSQGKLGKDAGSVAYYVRERLRTQIQRRHAGSGAGRGEAAGRSMRFEPCA
jgi:hypothetical protein